MAKTTNIGLRVPTEWLPEIDDLVRRKFPHGTRNEWARSVVEQELNRQRNGKNTDTQIDRILTLVEEMHGVVMYVRKTNADD